MARPKSELKPDGAGTAENAANSDDAGNANSRENAGNPGSVGERETGKRRVRSDTRPQEIVAAAFEEFAEKGYAAARLEDVAARAKVSKGLPYLQGRAVQGRHP